MCKETKKQAKGIKIVLTGPESSGKTTLCRQLAKHFETAWVAEYARDYLTNLGRTYTQTDLLEIAKGQQAREWAQIQKYSLLFCDTSMLVLKVWSNYKYGHCDPWIEQQFLQNPVDLYVLCKPDIAWEADLLREHPRERDSLYAIYKKELMTAKKPFIEMGGGEEERLNDVIAIVQQTLRTGCQKV